MYSASQVTGPTLIEWAGVPSFGHFDAGAIDLEKSKRGSSSIVPTAIRYFEKIAGQVGVSITSLSAENEAILNGALLAYIAGQYFENSRLSGLWKPCDTCDQKPELYWYEMACRLLGDFSLQMQSLAGFCTAATIDDLPDIFGASLHLCGEEIDT